MFSPILATFAVINWPIVVSVMVIQLQFAITTFDLVRALTGDVVGMELAAWEPGTKGDQWARGVLTAFQANIAGGTDEIQKNIIGDRVLGLPREPSVDRGVPFNELLVGTQRSPDGGPR